MLLLLNSRLHASFVDNFLAKYTTTTEIVSTQVDDGMTFFILSGQLLPLRPKLVKFCIHSKHKPFTAFSKSFRIIAIILELLGCDHEEHYVTLNWQKTTDPRSSPKT